MEESTITTSSTILPTTRLLRTSGVAHITSTAIRKKKKERKTKSNRMLEGNKTGNNGAKGRLRSGEKVDSESDGTNARGLDLSPLPPFRAGPYRQTQHTLPHDSLATNFQGASSFKGCTSMIERAIHRHIPRFISSRNWQSL